MTIHPIFLIVLLSATLISAISVLLVRRLISAVVIFGVFSFCSALFFAALGALDVAFTEACVGAAITTVLFVSSIYRAQREEGII